MIERQRTERAAQVERLALRQQKESLERQARFRKDLPGLWDHLRGEHKRIKLQIERDAETATHRDCKEKDRLIFKQLAQRRMLKQRSIAFRQWNAAQRPEVETDPVRFEEMKKSALKAKREEFIRQRQQKQRRPRPRSRNRNPEP